MTHLTIDLDYFLYPNSCAFDDEYDNCVKLLHKIEELKIPLVVKEEHHNILSYVNKFKFDRILNVDYHSDIVHDISLEEDDIKLDLNCGTWANFYKHRESCIFEWRHPVRNIDHTNLCDNQFDYSRSCLYKSKISYFDVKHRFGFSRIPKDIHSISIALSKDYCVEDLFDSITREFGWLYHGHKKNMK